MPVANYGILKARIQSWSLSQGRSHVELQLEGAGDGLDMVVAINAVSQSSDSELVYYLDLSYHHAQFLGQLSELSPGSHPCSGGAVPSLDFVRTTPVPFESGSLVPHCPDRIRDEVPDEISRFLSRAVNDGAMLYVFGSLSCGCVVNVHMNQGSTGFFRRDNGISQDGGVIIEFPDGRWAALFMSFTSQAILTDDVDGQPAGSPLRACFAGRAQYAEPADGTQHIEPVDGKTVPDEDLEIEVDIEKPEDDLGDPAAIRDRSKTCQELFAQCQEYPLLSGGDWIDQLSAKFNWWSLGIGAEKNGHSSLDYRVRGRTDVRDVLVHLLDSLTVSLKNCIEIAEDPDRLEADSSGSSLPDQDSELGEQIYYIRTTIEFLSRISVAIRKSGTKFPHRKADKLLPQREHKLKEFRDYLRYTILVGPWKMQLLNFIRNRQTVSNEQIWRKVAIVVQASLRDTSRLSPVQERLIQANLVRRNRIDVYQHRLKGRTGMFGASATCLSVNPKEEPQATKGEKAPAPSREGSTRTRAREIPRAPPTAELSAVSSGSATKLAPSFVLPSRPLEGDAKSVGTKVSQGVFKQDYPRCPASKESDFFCPYCAQPLDSSYSDPKNSRKWRGHIAEDLSPYVCVYADCDKADAMYVTTADLKKHFKDCHSVPSWTCDTCRLEVGAPERAEFDQEEDWYAHMAAEHDGEFEEDDLPALAEVSLRAGVQSVACPLCHENAVLLRPDIDGHIAEHMHSFALQALPWDNIEPDDGTRASVGSIPGNPVLFANSQGSEENVDWNEPQNLNELLSDTVDALNVLVGITTSIPRLRAFIGVFNQLERAPVILDRPSASDPAVLDEIAVSLSRLCTIFQRHLDNNEDHPGGGSTDSLLIDIDQAVESLKALLKLLDSSDLEDKKNPAAIVPDGLSVPQVFGRPEGAEPPLESSESSPTLEQIAVFREYQRLTGMPSTSREGRPSDLLLRLYIPDGDFIFLVDDSQSMKHHWAAVKLVLTTLIMKVSPFVSSGLDLEFCNSKNSSVFFPKSRISPGDIEAIMDEVGKNLDHHPANLPALAEYFNKGNATITRQRILVLFGDGDQWVPYFREAMFDIAVQLQPELRNQCTIQFVVFGAAVRLELLVDELRGPLENFVMLDVKKWNHEEVDELILGTLIHSDDEDE